MSEKLNLPIYRAKKIDSDECVEGFHTANRHLTKHWIRWDGYMTEVDQSTLAIHFPDMLDSEGTKIFASLSEDGKGGDICNYIFFDGDNHHRKYSDTAKFNGLYGVQPRHLTEVKRGVKVTGIQE